YFLRLGCLDGRAGLTYCLLQAVYEYQIAIKAREYRAAQRKAAKAGLPPPVMVPPRAASSPAPIIIPTPPPSPTVPPTSAPMAGSAAAAQAGRDGAVDLSYNPSPHSLRNRIGRGLWGLVYVFLFRPSLPPMHKWRIFLLRCFGAKVSWRARPYPRCRV